MNKIYKVVWSKTKGCYEVVGEFAKGHSRDKRSGLVKAGVGLGLVALMLSCFGASTVNAKVQLDGAWIGSENDSTVAIGKESDAIGGSSVAIGGGRNHRFGPS